MSDDTPIEGDPIHAPRLPLVMPTSHLPLPPINFAPPPIRPPAVNLRVPLDDDLPPLQRRWTIAIRWLMLFPHFVVLFLVCFGGLLFVIAAWFAALVTGRVPQTLASFLRVVVRWTTRVNASNSLLTDIYPPFDGDDDPTYPIGVEFPESGRLNRWSVLFRIVLMVPATFVGGCIQVGVFAFSVVFWISALILGRLPDPLYRAAATVLRYNARVYSFAWMLTSEYPWGWKGDGAMTTPSTNTAPIPEQASGYWSSVTRVTEVPLTTESTRFDFHLVGWSMAWIWIWFIIGVFSYVRGR